MLLAYYPIVPAAVAAACERQIKCESVLHGQLKGDLIVAAGSTRWQQHARSLLTTNQALFYAPCFQIEGLPTIVFIPKDNGKPALRTEGLLPAQQIMDIVADVEGGNLKQAQA